MTRTVMMLLFVGGMGVLVGAQVSAPAFDVVSIKPAAEAVPVGRPSPGVFRSGRNNLVQLIYGPPFPPIGNQGFDTRGVSFFTALQEQAGLKLEAARELVDVIVIDSAQVPAPN